MKIILTNANKMAIYEQISSQIKNQIISGELKSGQMLPSIRSLAKELSVSVITTKRAYDELEKEHFIESFQGKGSFVSSQDSDLMREKKLNIIEQKFSEALNDAKNLGLSREDIFNMLTLLMEE